MNRYGHHLLACNAWEPGRFVPLLVAGQRAGWVRRDHLRLLADFGDVFTFVGNAVSLDDRLETAAMRSAAIARVGGLLAAAGDAPALRGELFQAVRQWGEPALFEVDRGLVPFFGVTGFGVHLNGYFQDDDGLGLWIGHRSATKKVDPLKLDNVVAGGIASGHGILETLLKEGAEEAAMTPELLAAARPAGEIRYRLDVPEGMRDDVLFLYDLEVPADFEPRNTDGEFDSFERMALTKCLDLVAGTEQFKFNVNLTVIDFALRHGAIPPDHPEHAFLVPALRGSLIRDA